MEYADIAVDQLVHDPENPRLHNAQNFEAIKKSLEAHGQVEPLVVQKSTNMVIAGNARLEVLRSMGHEKVKVVLLDVSDKDARKLSISMNRAGELAEWNEDVLAKHLGELSDLSDFDPMQLGFTGDEFEDILNSFGGELDEMDFGSPPEEGHRTGNEVNADSGTITKTRVGEAAWDDGSGEVGSGDGVDIVLVGSPTVATNRMIQLVFDSESCEKFKEACKNLAYAYDTDNMPDTVYLAVMNEYERNSGGKNEDSGEVEGSD